MMFTSPSHQLVSAPLVCQTLVKKYGNIAFGAVEYYTLAAVCQGGSGQNAALHSCTVLGYYSKKAAPSCSSLHTVGAGRIDCREEYDKRK
jgi:hypothetical protein